LVRNPFSGDRSIYNLERYSEIIDDLEDDSAPINEKSNRCIPALHVTPPTLVKTKIILGRMVLNGLCVPIQAHWAAAEEAAAQSNRCQSTVGKHLSALAPKADMPHRQQRLTERTGKGPGSIRHGRLSPVDVEIRSLPFLWAIRAR
jgi:hypothetical protein